MRGAIRVTDDLQDSEIFCHRVMICLVPHGRKIRGVEEAKVIALATTTENSRPTLQPSERVCELSGPAAGLLRVVPKTARVNKDEIQVKYYTWKIGPSPGATRLTCTGR